MTTDRLTGTPARRAALLLCGLAALLVTQPAHGRGIGFMVKPMRIEFQVDAGRRAATNLELRNTSGERQSTVDLRLVELSQGANGRWRIIEPGDAEEAELEGLASCRPWTQLEGPSVTLDPFERRDVRITFDVPARARGVYFAGIIAQTRPPEGATGIRTVIRFLIPVIVEIRGRSVRQNVNLEDVGMTFRERSSDSPATTFVHARVANPGLTYSRLRGTVRVEREWEGRWRPVTEAALPSANIIPGAGFDIRHDIERRLPSGRYRLTGTLYVDGRRLPTLTEEIEFAGDPDVTEVSVDSALTLEPDVVDVTGTPGATRTAVVALRNLSDDAVTVRPRVEVPGSLQGVMMGELRGDDLACAEWTTVAPAEFTLRGGGRQNLRVVTRVPAIDAPQAVYYASLVFDAAYPDGQSAGETRTLLALRMQGVELEPKGECISLSVAQGEGSEYVISARFANTGNVHYDATARARLTDPTGMRGHGEAMLSGETGRMLPLQMRDYSGLIDFADIEPGVYVLRVVLDLDGAGRVVRETGLRVEDEDGERIVTQIERPAEEPAGDDDAE